MTFFCVYFKELKCYEFSKHKCNFIPFSSFGFRSLDIVSSFDIRISDLNNACSISTTFSIAKTKQRTPETNLAGC